MKKHEEKKCSRCMVLFECRAGSIEQCQCNTVAMSEEERAFLEDRYSDCLCLECLLQLKNRYILFKEKMYWK